MSKHVADYCKSCIPCQQRRFKVTRDHIPITPTPRSELPFQHITMDCIIDLPSSKGHKYCLCIVDSCTQCPAVYLLRKLDVKDVCDVLIGLFMHVDVATVKSSDNAFNFVNKLMQEFEVRLGCSLTGGI